MARLLLCTLAVGLALADHAHAFNPIGAWKLDRMNRKLQGRVIDHTHNHGADRRIWSNALCQKRDLYVYVPPCYDPNQKYPVVLFFHGFTQDETSFFYDQIEIFDKAIACGTLPPCIVAWPDGSLQGRRSFINSASFFANSKAGNYEDYILEDVWPFLLNNYPIRPEREAHVIAGASMGGSAAARLAITQPNLFGPCVAFFPALNLRWVDCHNRYRGNFDPCCWGWRTQLRPYEVVGVFYGVIHIQYKHLIDPLYGRSADAIDAVARINPIELLDVYDVKPGQLDMYVAYGGKDEFNIDAHVESFVHRAKERGIDITVDLAPNARHSTADGNKMIPASFEWLARRIAQFAPPGCCVRSEVRTETAVGQATVVVE